MLFNSYIFLFLFLPLTLFGFHFIGKYSKANLAIAWLVGASLFFYGWWNPAYLVLLLFSIIFNFTIGVFLSRNSKSNLTHKAALIIGIIINLSVLGYFKYANFFIDNLNFLAETNIILNEIILPLGISFFTFQQITYLVDAYYQETKEYSFLHYCLFVTFFPQLIAGPIVHHKEMMPQFLKDTIYKIQSKNLAIGLTIFIIGLFKKVIIADGISVYSTPVFNAAEAGILLTFFEAWTGALAYTFQLYFDFSGYSDMAIGIAIMFGIMLPLNFNSPYKATNISDFWKRWHITLSRLIRNYLWDPVSLTLTRFALNRGYGNLSIFTLTIIFPILFSFFWIGLWHGAGWNFILFGFLHGFYIVIFHIWIKFKLNFLDFKLIKNSILSKSFGWLITFICVVFAWVLFRANNLDSAINLYRGMLGINGYLLPESYLAILNKILGLGNFLEENGFKFGVPGFFEGITQIGLIFIVGLIAFIMPNTYQFMSKNLPEKFANELDEVKLRFKLLNWKPSYLFSLLFAVIFSFTILNISKNSEFLYFQF